MNINELGRVVDYLYDRVKPNFPNEYPEDVYGVIYNKVKKNGIKNMKYEDVIKENISDLRNAFRSKRRKTCQAFSMPSEIWTMFFS